MPDQTIKCPNCGLKIELTEALTGAIRDKLRAEVEAEANKKEEEFSRKLQALKVQEKSLARQQQQLNDDIEKRIKTEKEKITSEVYKKAHEEISERIKVLEAELEEKREQISEATKKELELRRQQRELEEKQEALELEVARKMDAERKKIAEEASKKATEDYRLQMRQKDDLIKSMQGQIEELKRKAETGSQERQGEALEEELLEVLERNFPYDKFEEIKKGQRGADILQKVHNKIGKECGTILWELKNTKDFSKSWIDKLKKDQQEVNADIPVIMSVALPKEVNKFGRFEDVWVTDYASAISLAVALRHTLISVARQKLITAGQDTMKDVIYQYITGQEFAMHIKAVVSAFERMQMDLEKEKRAMNKIWKSREKQILAVLDNITGMYGEIDGLVGGRKVLPPMETLSLEAITSEDEEYD